MRLENWLYTVPLRLRSLLVRHRQDEDLDEELRDHIARQTEENRSRGMGEEEARLAALRTFGNFVAVREQTHETWAWATMGRLSAGFPSRASIGAARAVAFERCRAGPGHWAEHWRVRDCECDVSQGSNAC